MTSKEKANELYNFFYGREAHVFPADHENAIEKALKVVQEVQDTLNEVDEDSEYWEVVETELYKLNG